MKSQFVVLWLSVVVSIGVCGCGNDSTAAFDEGFEVNNSEAVVTLVNDTAKIYEDFAKQLESNFSSGQDSGKAVEGLVAIQERFKSRADVEIGPQVDAFEQPELRAYYLAVAGQELEQEEAVDPRIRSLVEKLKSLSEQPNVRDFGLENHVEGYVMDFLNHCNMKPRSSIVF